MALIAFDCDGPLAEFTRGFCAGLTERGHKRDESTIKHWDLALSLTDQEVALVDEVISEPGYCSNLAWVEGAKRNVRALRALGHECLVVTSPYPSSTWIPERLNWLSDLFPADDILFVRGRRKCLVRADVLVEDHAGIAGAWLDAHPQGFAVLVDRPWNQPGSAEFWPHSRMARAHNADEVLGLVREFVA
jgi:5'(3')-deoxyribonucleotidase